MQCLQPRGRYDIKLYPSFVHLHGKSFDFKIPKGTITRLMMLPHPDNRQIFFVVQLEPPIKHGQTRYHFVIILFDKNDHTDIDLTATEEWLQDHYEGKISRNVAGPTHEVVARVFKASFHTFSLANTTYDTLWSIYITIEIDYTTECLLLHIRPYVLRFKHKEHI